ncbi:MAG: hypothetical protein R3C44_08750 [Chloroflexota bacterium]
MRQLRTYKRFKEAAAWLEDRINAGLRTYLRVAPPPRIEGRLDMTGISTDTLLFAMQDVLTRTILTRGQCPYSPTPTPDH